MHEIFEKRTVYGPKGKLERIVYIATLPKTIASGIDRHDFAYDYNYDITEDDNYYEPKIGNNNDTTIAKHDANKKNHFGLSFSFVVFAMSSVLLSAS